MPTPTLYLNGKFLSQPTTGVQRFARELFLGMDRMLPNDFFADEVVVLTPRQTLYDLPFQKLKVRKVGRLAGHLWEQFDLPRATGSAPLYSPFSAPAFKSNQAVTFHEPGMFARPESYSWKFRTFYKFIYRSVCRRARGIFTATEFGREQLNRYVGRSMERIHVAYDGADHMQRVKADPRILAKLPAALHGNYVLAVASMSPHKNFKGLLQAMQSVELPLVIVGSVNDSVFRETHLTFGPNVHRLGFVSDEELRALYEHARCFVFPSFYEGFGLPPLEALSCGTPSVVGRAACLPEVLGDGVLYCDPHDPADIAAQIVELYSNQKLRGELLQRGQSLLKKYTWDRCAARILELIDMTFK